MQKPDWVYFRANTGSIEEMRNEIVKSAMASACSHLIMMDADQVYPPETIPRLLSHNLPVVGALVHRRWPPFDPIIYKGEINSYVGIEEWEKDSLIEVDATGTGCILYSMEVFENTQKPWFQSRSNIVDSANHPIGEDIGFCSELRKSGYKIFVDTSITIGHLSEIEITDGTWKLYKKMKEAEKKNNFLASQEK